MARMNADFAQEVEEELQLGAFDALVEPSVRGINPDFIVSLPNGRQVLLEAKGWSPSPENIKRATKQARYFRDELGFEDSFVVLPSLPSEPSPPGEVIALHNLSDILRRLAEHTPDSSPPPIEESKPFLFCAMPFDESYDDVFLIAMRDAADSNGLTARRVDQEDYVGDVVEYILSLIRRSAVVVADISDENPNVMYEAGFAEALGKPVVPICSKPLSDMPFNVAHRNTIEYQRGRVAHLVSKLTTRVAAALGQSEAGSQSRRA